MQIAALAKAQRQDMKKAVAHPLYGKFRPRGARLVVTRPHNRISGEQKMASGLIKPASVEQHAHEAALFCTVLAVGGGVVDAGLAPGSIVLIPWYGGTIIYDDTEGCETDFWIVGEAEVMATLELTNGA